MEQRQSLGGPNCFFRERNRAREAVAAELVRRGLIEYERRKSALLNDQYSTHYLDLLFAPERRSAPTVGELAKQFWEKRARRQG